MWTGRGRGPAAKQETEREMRYWEAGETVTRAEGRSSDRRRREQSSIASGGSVRQYPFLRRLYQHPSVSNGRVRKALFFLVLAGVIYAVVLGDGGLIQIALPRHERARLGRDISELQVTRIRLEAEITRLENDPFYFEKIGRERFGYIRPGDKVYRIMPER